MCYVDKMKCKLCNKSITKTFKAHILCEICGPKYFSEWMKNKRYLQKTISPKEYWITCAHERAKHRAKIFNFPFDIDIHDIEPSDTCPILGINLNYSGKTTSDYSPSLDKRDNNKGYVKGNITVISYKANRMKSNATILDIEKVILWMKQKLAQHAK